MCLKVLKNGAWIEYPPPSESSFFSPLLPDLVGRGVTLESTALYSKIKGKIIFQYAANN